MIDLDKWNEIFNTIKMHKLRTFLTALGVFWGIFMLVFLMGAGQGLENGVMKLMGGHAKNSMYVWTQKTSKPYKGLPPGRFIRLTWSDALAVKNQFPDEIQYMAPRLWMRGEELIRGDKKGAFQLRGDGPDLIHIDAIVVDEGRFLNQMDMEQKRKVAVIGRRVKEVLYEEDEEAIGTYVKMDGVEYKVVGVFKSDRRGENAAEDEQEVMIPLTTAQQISNRPDRIGMFVCAMYPNVTVSSVEPRIVNMLKERHNVAPEDRQGVRSNNVEQEFNEITGLFMGIKFIVWFVGIGSLFAGVIGVGNIMLIVVKERTKEIGVRKAMGATPRSIISMILMESIFITTIAGYLGLAASTFLIALMNMAVGEGTQYYHNPEVNLPVGIIAIIILVISGTLIGLIPAIQAANINPVHALKDE